jgi:transposase
VGAFFSSGGKTHQGRLLPQCNKWLRWAFVEAAWVSVGCSPYFGDFYEAKRARGKKANTAILAIARRMARITWSLLTQERT